MPVLDLLHGYYFDSLNGFRYIADKKIKLNRYIKVIEDSPKTFKLEEDYNDGFKKVSLYYKSFEYINEVLKEIENKEKINIKLEEYQKLGNEKGITLCKLA